MKAEYFPFPERWKGKAYLNAASCSPILREAYNESLRFYKELAEGADIFWDEWIERVEKTRKIVADFINASTSEITFQLNTSTCMNILALMLREKVKNVLTFRHEFPSSTIPWLHNGYKVYFVEPEGYIFKVEDIERSITENEIEVLVTSHVQFSSGFKQDLKKVGKICKEYQVVFIVNATQSAGQVEIDVRKFKCQALMFSTFKWICAGYSAAVLFLEKKFLREHVPPLAGWRSVINEEEMKNTNTNLKNEAKVLELGCLHFPCIFAVGGAVKTLKEVGIKRIEKYNLRLKSSLEEMLKNYNISFIELPEESKSGITIVKGYSEDDVKRLESLGVFVAYRNGIRICTHFFNDEEDIFRVVNELVKLSE
jgi:selenocysteine lyase/cysteine desulfurase